MHYLCRLFSEDSYWSFFSCSSSTLNTLVSHRPDHASVSSPAVSPEFPQEYKHFLNFLFLFYLKFTNADNWIIVNEFHIRSYLAFFPHTCACLYVHIHTYTQTHMFYYGSTDNCILPNFCVEAVNWKATISDDKVCGRQLRFSEILWIEPQAVKT